MQYFKQHISALLQASLREMSVPEIPDKEDIEKMLEYPPSPENGDLAFPCFKFSKILRKSPAVIASEIAGVFPHSEFIEKTVTVGGYLNFYLSHDAFLGFTLKDVLSKNSDYGRSTEGNGKTVVLDYSSPNVAKPFHIGHLGTTVIGHSIKKMHEFSGYKCVGVNHLGDWGTQFGKLIVAYRKYGDEQTVIQNGIDELVRLYVLFHSEAEKDHSLDDLAREEFAKLEKGDEENKKLWKWFIEISLTEYKKTYAQLGIEFDSYCGESFYYDKIPAVISRMREKNILKIDGGASIVDLSDYDMPPCLILKSDGSTLYPARDIAAAIYRKQTYDFSKCIYVTDAGQSLYFRQWFKVISLMGYDFENQLVHIPYGKVSIGGEKLATRTGNVILLKDLFKTAVDKVLTIMNEKNPDLPNKEEAAEAVGVGAIVFHYLSGGRIKNIDFTVEDALSFDGNTGPYAQYTYARTCSILAKAGDAVIKAENADKYVATAEEEFELIKQLSLFPEKVKSALDAYEPSFITRYIFDTATVFNRFYHNCPVLSADSEEVTATRLMLTKATGIVLKSAFSLICMKAPEKI